MATCWPRGMRVEVGSKIVKNCLGGKVEKDLVVDCLSR